MDAIFMIKHFFFCLIELQLVVVHLCLFQFIKIQMKTIVSVVSLYNVHTPVLLYRTIIHLLI